MCTYFREKKYSGTLCDELCVGDNFKDFKCPSNGLKTAIFTAVKNHDVYAIKMAKNIKTSNDIVWYDKYGNTKYPKIEEFERMIKTKIIISYNYTLEDDMIKALLNQEMTNSNDPEQMCSIWRLFNDNNYIMGKIFEDDSIFPTIFGSCGPYYATENLKSIQPETGIRYYITIDWESRLKFAMSMLEYIFRLDEIKPEPLRICKIDLHNFGVSIDNRIKYQIAEYIHTESQINKILSDGTHCNNDKDCVYENCIGKCDKKLNICNGIQQNNNLQIVCNIFKGNNRFSPGFLITTKTPTDLLKLIEKCANTLTNENNYINRRIISSTNEIGIKLYNEIKQIYNKITFRQK